MAVIKYCMGIIVFACLEFSVVTSKRGYMLTFPEELQIGAPEQFCLTLHNVSRGISLKLNLTCYGRTAEYQSLSLHQENHECFVWRIPEFLTPGTCDMQVQGTDEIEDYKFRERKEVKIVDTHQMTFIQSDKPMYKPGEIVKFRILTVTQDLLPLSQSVDRVTVQDPHGFYMKEWKDHPVKSGFVSLEFKLYEKPLFGEWKIEAVVNGRKNHQIFIVEEYVLPKFQVALDMQDSLTVATGTLMFEVCSKYTFGKPVQGVLNASVCLKNTHDSWFCQSNVRPCAQYNSEINGCHEFQIETDSLKITERRFSLLCQPLLVLDVNVTEKNTGITVHETKTGTGVWEERIKLKFVSQKYFKPFFPYQGKILVTFPTGRPAPGEEVRVTIGKLAIEKTLVSNSEGLVEFTIQNLTNSVDSFVMNAKSTDKETVDRKKYTLYAASAKKHVKQWYSPTSSYIRVSTRQKGHHNCGDNLTLEGVYSALPSTLIKKGYLQVISKGNILRTEDITEIVKRSVPYIHKIEGIVFYPILSSSIVLDNSIDDGIFSDLAQQGPMFAPDGPPGYDKMAPAAPPGAPGSKSGLEKDNAPAPGENRVPDQLDKLVVHPTRNSLVVEWEPNRRSKIPVRGYYLGYGNRNADVYKLPFDANTFSYTIENLQPGSEYVVSVLAFNNIGQGQARYESVFTKEGTDKKSSKIPILRNFTTSIPVTHEMAPTVRILVYLVTADGEMVADTTDLHVKHCDKNRVEMYFTQKTATPGDKVGMVLNAAPNSLCSTTMVDKSVLLHGGSNLVKKTDVLNKLKDLDLTSDFIDDWRYCSDISDMPPLLLPNAPPSRTGPPGDSSYTDKEQAPPSTSFRKRRSIQQFHSNMYDSLLAFKVAGIVAMTDLDLQTRPCVHSDDEVDDPVGPPYLPGDARWPVPGMEGSLEEFDPAEDPKNPGMLKSNLRRTFPETWLWDLYEIPSSGTLTVNHTIGDTVTEWVGNAYCSNPGVGFGVSDVVRITGFQSFFMSVKMPYAVIRGEIVNIDVLVFNYLPHCINIQVNLVKNGRFTVEKDEENPVFCICSRESKSHKFRIRPQVLGAISLTFSGFLREHRINCESTRAPFGFARKQVTDIVVKQLLVQPEGIQVERTSSHYICPKDSIETDYFKMTLSSDLPKDSLVPGSLTGWINVMGDIMGPVLNGLENLVLLPTGCGEQNMVRMAPNIAVLQYLTSTRQLSDDTEIKALDYLNKGYQQQLKFMHPDGSYSAFGLTDDQGSTWLTAFVFKTLRQAMHFIYIDRKQIQTKSWEFLLHQQREDGCFDEKGKVLGKYMMGGVAGSKEDKKRALTAYVLLSMLESFKMMRERTPPFIALAIKCIEVDNLTDPYTLALVSYAMTLYKPESDFTAMLLTKLKDQAIIEGNMMYWKREKKPAILSGQGTAASAEIEMTAYSLLAFLTVNENVPIKEVIPIVRWLTHQRNAYGGFSSTQDTVIALQALSLFAERIYGDGLDVSVNIATGRGDSLDFRVSDDNSILLQQQSYSHPESDVHVTAKGDGCILLQTTQHYNVLNKVLPDAAFDLNVTTPVTMEILNNDCSSRIIRICVRYTGTDTVSNMVVIETKVLSGWVPDIASLKKVLTREELGMKLYEIDNRNPDMVNFYFDQLDNTEVCFEFTIFQEMEIDNKQPAVVKVFDYYETELEVTTFYELSECTEDELEVVDVNLKDNDLYVEDPDEMEEDLNNIYDLMDAVNTPEGAFSDKDEPKVDPNSPGPLGKQTKCPLCSGGGSSVLHNICTKQIWTTKREGDNLLLRVVTPDSLSPELSIPFPDGLKACTECTDVVAQGRLSLAVLTTIDWQDIGKSFVASDTMILEWTESLQNYLQTVLSKCIS